MKKGFRAREVDLRWLCRQIVRLVLICEKSFEGCVT